MELIEKALKLDPTYAIAHAYMLSRGSSPAGRPAEPLVSYQIYRQLSARILPP
jgi:hypothetical protein